MRFLRTSLASLMILALLCGHAFATDSTTAPSTETSVTPPADETTDTGSTEAESDTPESDPESDASESDPESETPDEEGDTTEPEVPVYEAKAGGTVLSITQPEGDTPGTITLLIGDKEVTFPFTAEMLEGEVEVGSYVEVKGTTESIDQIEKTEGDEEHSGMVKTQVVSVTTETEDGSATITLMIGGQAVTFSAEELSIPAEALDLITAGAEFKIETNQEGQTEMKISGESGEIKVEVNEDGSVEVKVETDKEQRGKGHEISEEKKAEAAEHREEARNKAEESEDEDEAGDSKGKGKAHKR